jgi:hypothetical protein
VDRISKAFLPEDENFMADIYDPLDVRGMPYISLINVGVHRFMTFLNATRHACHLAADEDGFYEHQARWAELLDMLTSDSRYAKACQPRGTNGIAPQ